jgi:hypothetical protein
VTFDNWFAIILFCGIYLSCLLLLDAAHKAHQTELRSRHREQVDGLHRTIRTLNREVKWLESERAKYKAALARRHDNPFDPFATSSTTDPVHIQWLPPSEEYDERE